MRKVIKAMEAKKSQRGADAEQEEARQREDMITSWPSVVSVDLMPLRQGTCAEVADASRPMHQKPLMKSNWNNFGIITLSDGTQVTFAILGHFRSVQAI